MAQASFLPHHPWPLGVSHGVCPKVNAYEHSVDHRVFASKHDFQEKIRSAVRRGRSRKDRVHPLILGTEMPQWLNSRAAVLAYGPSICESSDSVAASRLKAKSWLQKAYTSRPIDFLRCAEAFRRQQGFHCGGHPDQYGVATNTGKEFQGQNLKALKRVARRGFEGVTTSEEGRGSRRLPNVCGRTVVTSPRAKKNRRRSRSYSQSREEREHRSQS